MRSRRLLLAALLMLVITGCAPAAGGGASPTPTASSPPQNLAALKKAAGIPDCPKSDAGVHAVPHGLPDLSLPCLGGGQSVRLAGLRGRPMMINLWAQWCAPCREESGYLASAAASNKTHLMILGINFNDPQPALAIEFAQAVHWRYPQLQDQDKIIGPDLQVSAIPQTFLVDAGGRIVYRHSGPFKSKNDIRSALATHLNVHLPA